MDDLPRTSRLGQLTRLASLHYSKQLHSETRLAPGEQEIPQRAVQPWDFASDQPPGPRPRLPGLLGEGRLSLGSHTLAPNLSEPHTGADAFLTR